MTEDDRQSLEAGLLAGPLLLDGAMGTLLTARMTRAGAAHTLPCLLNLSDPALVRQAHLDYLAVGAEILTTNSFCASKPYFEQHGVDANVTEVNFRAVQLARDAISQSHAAAPRWVAGAMAPLPARTDKSLWHNMFYAQAKALVNAGCDLVVCETFVDSEQAAAALRACRTAAAASGKVIPLILSVAPIQPALDQSWQDPITFADCAGVNCVADSEVIAHTLDEIMRWNARPAWLKPSAGTPVLDGGQLSYPLPPQSISALVQLVVDRYPVCAVGGCCGTTPSHISAVRRLLDQRKSSRSLGTGES